ncbi:MAG: phosphoenolpyruvate synthase/pyruvate phosphate dikinase [Desulfofustis sp.]|nr:phosphoenolpyruvate synthase/pyruvate phosphate dikinase [Desulfofustis sp.]
MTAHPKAEIKTASRFKLFHDLMPHKVSRILLISTPYEAWIMEEDCRLSEQIVNEYRGLNLSKPPRLNWASSAEEAIGLMSQKDFDFVISICPSINADAFEVAADIKSYAPHLPVVLLTHQEAATTDCSETGHLADQVDHIFFWSGQVEILLAIIKCIEDRFNVDNDISCADVRVILFVEDSPFYLSSILPVIYKELVIETQNVIDDGLNEEHRLLIMRARPKVLVAHSYEQALHFYQTYRENILGVVSDVRYARGAVLDPSAGIDFLRTVARERFDIPLMLISSEPHNSALAKHIPAQFADKNQPDLRNRIRDFMVNHLGFGNFVFKNPDGTVIDQARDLYDLELKLAHITEESFLYHCRNNDFSRWLYSIAEVELADHVRELRNSHFDNTELHRRHLIELIKMQRQLRQRGVLVNFDRRRFDPDNDFSKIGNGSLGGKARGLAFLSTMRYQHDELFSQFDTVSIIVPQTCALTTECFDAFMSLNDLETLVKEPVEDEALGDFFSRAEFPEPFLSDLRIYLERIHYPLAVRSSSLLEDAQFKSYAGLYQTHILTNDHPDLECRLAQLVNAVKMIYASTYFQAPKSFSKRVGNKTEHEKMAVIIQKAVGTRYGEFFYPSFSGVAQSLNYYPFSHIKTTDGIAHIAVGFGKAVMEGENNLRFSPRHPQILPQRSTVEDIVKRAQRQFYALKMGGESCLGTGSRIDSLYKRDTIDAAHELPLQRLSSFYEPDEHRIREGASRTGYPIVTFNSILKHRLVPLGDILTLLLDLGREKLGCAVELEFAVDFLPYGSELTARFAILQIRPMTAREETLDIDISDTDRARAFCISENGLGNTINDTMADIIYVKPDTFDPARTTQIAQEIGAMNTRLMQEERRFILIGPGRWGSSDQWLGIPVGWRDISSVGCIVETVHERLQADPSQGSHFFHNITTLGISYLNVNPLKRDHIDWEWLNRNRIIQETQYVRHVRSSHPITLKVDGRSRSAVLIGDLRGK